MQPVNHPKPAPKTQDADGEALALAHFKKVNPHLANDPHFDSPEKSLTMQAYLAGRESLREELEFYKRDDFITDEALRLVKQEKTILEAQLQTANKALEEIAPYCIGWSGSGDNQRASFWQKEARRLQGIASRALGRE